MKYKLRLIEEPFKQAMMEINVFLQGTQKGLFIIAIITIIITTFVMIVTNLKYSRHPKQVIIESLH